MKFTGSFLQAVVDALLPGLPQTEQAAAIPAASQVEVDHQLAHHLKTHPERALIGQALEAIARQAGGMAQFTAADTLLATEILQEVERSDHETFLALLFVVSADYYENTAVLQAFGWPDTPPQPAGYALPPFDETLLNPVKGRQALWRRGAKERRP